PLRRRDFRVRLRGALAQPRDGRPAVHIALRAARDRARGRRGQRPRLRPPLRDVRRVVTVVGPAADRLRGRPARRRLARAVALQARARDAPPPAYARPRRRVGCRHACTVRPPRRQVVLLRRGRIRVRRLQSRRRRRDRVRRSHRSAGPVRRADRLLPRVRALARLACRDPRRLGRGAAPVPRAGTARAVPRRRGRGGRVSVLARRPPDPQGAAVGAPAAAGGLRRRDALAEHAERRRARAARGARARVAWNAAGARLRDGARHAFPARRRSRPLRRRPRTRRHDRRLPPLRDLPPRQGAVALVDAAAAHDAEWLQRVARLRRDRVGARPRLRARVAELRAVRGAARAGGGAVAPAAPRAACAAAAQGPFPARQPAALQPEVLPDVAAPLCRLREAARPAARPDRRACPLGLPPVRQAGADVTWSIAGGLVLALASAAALNWGYYAQQRAAAALPPLSLRQPMRSL